MKGLFFGVILLVVCLFSVPANAQSVAQRASYLARTGTVGHFWPLKAGQSETVGFGQTRLQARRNCCQDGRVFHWTSVRRGENGFHAVRHNIFR